MATAVEVCVPPTSVAAVANEFLRLSEAEGGVPLDQMKLQKLLYYAHAWYLAYNDTPLFEDDFEAWPWGPVVRDVYIQTKDYGRSPITAPLWEFGRKPDGRFDFVTPGGVPENLKPFIKSIWDVHKSFTGVQLSNATHAPGEPWTIIKDRLGTESKPKIPNHLIASVYREKLKKPHGYNTAA
jgi:uncharacterized phage-associated protein